MELSGLSRPRLAVAWCLMTLVVICVHLPPRAHAASKLGGTKKVVYVASELGFAIAGPSDWYGAVQAEGPAGQRAYPRWPPTRRAMYVKYADEDATSRVFNPTLIIELMDAEGKSASDSLRYVSGIDHPEPGISVLEAPAERTIGGRTWATCRLRVPMGNRENGPVVIQQWYATVHRPALVLVVGGSTEQEFGEDSVLFERAIKTATFGSHPERSHGD